MREVRQELAVVRQQVRAALVGQLSEAPAWRPLAPRRSGGLALGVSPVPTRGVPALGGLGDLVVHGALVQLSSTGSCWLAGWLHPVLGLLPALATLLAAPLHLSPSHTPRTAADFS